LATFHDATPPWKETTITQGNARHVLVVDDEPMVVEVLTRYLAREGFHVENAHDGPTALRAASTRPPDVVVLDLMLPGMDGMHVCQELRHGSQVPILMLTARGDETDKVRGLGIGADDYVVKPFSPNEVVARVKALLRRSQKDISASVLHELRFPKLVIRPALREVECRDGLVALTAREFDLLAFMARHPRQVFTREQLLEGVWDRAFDVDLSTVTVHIRRVREKIERDPTHPQVLKTVWGVGYRFEPPLP
jgi:DNA-binding response OmpR family regulator